MENGMAGFIDSIMEDLKSSCEPKNNAKSAEFREIGNQYYRKETNDCYLDAIKWYNKSICYAEIDSEHLSLGYSNRSAVYFELKLYAECLQNIEMARVALGFPSRLAEKLEKRASDCQRLMKNNNLKTGTDQTKNPVEPSLSYPPHENVPYIANCLELRKSAEYGRYVITNRDLQVGQIIAIEEPFCTSLSNNVQYERCENCCLEKSRNLIPCNECTVVMFCSEECRVEAWNRFHKFECPIIDVIIRRLRSSDHRISLRATLCALSHFESIDALQTFIEETGDQDNNVFDVKITDEAAKYASVYSMQRASDVGYAEVVRTILRQVCLILVSKSKGLVDDENSEQAIKTLVEISQKHFLSTLLNRSVIADVAISMDLFKNNMNEQKDPTIGLYPFRFLLNHSCHPNICSSTNGNKIVIIVLRPIKAGEQIFDNYHFHHGKNTLVERQAGLSFKCCCIACKNDYPMINNMPKAPIPPPKKLWSECMIQMYQCNRNAAIANLNDIVRYLQENDRYYPALDIAMVSAYLRHAVELIYGKEIPLSASFVPIGGAMGEKLEIVKSMFEMEPSLS